MADSVPATGLEIQQWENDFFVDYTRSNRFSSYMGTSENAIIQVNEKPGKRQKGDNITFALANNLDDSVVTGTNVLEGNETDMTSRSHLLTVDKRRKAVRVAEMDEVRSAIDLRNAARTVLKNWATEDTKKLVLRALGSFRNGSTISSYLTQTEYAAISETTVKDVWLEKNKDRVLFGATQANLDTTGGGGGAIADWSDSLATVDNSADKMTTAVMSLAKLMARTADPLINPIKTRGDEEWFVVFMHPLQIRDLVQSDTVFQAAHREARERGKENPLFRGSDYVWDSLIIKEIPELPLVYNGSINTCAAYLCGAQALGFGLGKRWSSRVKEFDYGDKHGVAIEQIYGVEKLCFGTGVGDTDDQKAHGLVQIWTAAVG